jgi:nicotinamidase-related amidase
MTAKATYDPALTGLLLVDPYNDFLSEGGKLWPRVKEVAEQVGLIENLKAIVKMIREKSIQVFYVPHHRWEPGDYERWKHANRSQIASAKYQLVAKGSWGGDWHSDFVPQAGDLIIKEHWAQSGFANTDLDQQLKQYGVEKVIIVGLVANTCLESTGRFAMELGYHVTLVTDATAAVSQEMMHAAHKLNGPTYAHEILTTAELISALQAHPAPSGSSSASAEPR